jgi:hypothetical protein
MASIGVDIRALTMVQLQRVLASPYDAAAAAPVKRGKTNRKHQDSSRIENAERSRSVRGLEQELSLFRRREATMDKAVLTKLAFDLHKMGLTKTDLGRGNTWFRCGFCEEANGARICLLPGSWIRSGDRFQPQTEESDDRLIDEHIARWNHISLGSRLAAVVLKNRSAFFPCFGEGSPLATEEAELVAKAYAIDAKDPSTVTKFQDALREIEGRPEYHFWTSFARLLAKQPIDGDLESLTSAAKEPEKVPAPLMWGLKYIVRGDVLLDDGQVLTLDSLYDRANLDPPPYVELPT